MVNRFFPISPCVLTCLGFYGIFDVDCIVREAMRCTTI